MNTYMMREMYPICQIEAKKIWNASRICVSSLRRGHANLLCIVPILVYVMPKQTRPVDGHLCYLKATLLQRNSYAVQKVYGTRSSQAVPHPSTILARRCLTSVIGRERVYSSWYGRRQSMLISKVVLIDTGSHTQCYVKDTDPYPRA